MSRRNWCSTSNFCGRLCRRVSSASHDGDTVDLLGRDLSDVGHVLLAGRQPPLRVEGQADVGLGEQLLVELRLGEEVGVPGLQVEDDVEPGGARRVDPGPDVVERALERVVAVVARVRRGHRGDDLERRDHVLRADPVVRVGEVLRSLDGRIQRLLTE